MSDNASTLEGLLTRDSLIALLFRHAYQYLQNLSIANSIPTCSFSLTPDEQASLSTALAATSEHCCKVRQLQAEASQLLDDILLSTIGVTHLSGLRGGGLSFDYISLGTLDSHLRELVIVKRVNSPLYSAYPISRKVLAACDAIVNDLFLRLHREKIAVTAWYAGKLNSQSTGLNKPRSYTIKEAAEYLTTSESSVRRLIQENTLKAHKPPGKKIGKLINKRDLDEYLEKDFANQNIQNDHHLAGN